jgi:uncharacterized membrane protein
MLVRAHTHAALQQLFYSEFGHGLLPVSSASSLSYATFLQCAFMGYYACCAGDTWASELGILDSGACRLVTTCRRVPRGTNGGLSLTGTAASLVGGVFIGAVYVALNTFDATRYADAPDQWVPMLVLGGIAGLGGSMVCGSGSGVGAVPALRWLLG